MKLNLLFLLALACGLIGATANAQTNPPTSAPTGAPASTPTDTQSKADKCKEYATQAAQNSSSSTSAMRGAARGAAIDNNNGAGGVGSRGNGNNAAAKGAVVGAARKGAQKNDAYQTNYDQCMAQPWTTLLASSITFAGPNGWNYSRRVVDPSVFDQVKVGDKVDIISNTDLAVEVVQ